MAELETQKRPENGYKFAGPCIGSGISTKNLRFPCRHLTRCSTFIKYTVPCKMSANFYQNSRRQRRRPQYKKAKRKENRIVISLGS